MRTNIFRIRWFTTEILTHDLRIEWRGTAFVKLIWVSGSYSLARVPHYHPQSRASARLQNVALSRFADAVQLRRTHESQHRQHCHPLATPDHSVTHITGYSHCPEHYTHLEFDRAYNLQQMKIMLLLNAIELEIEVWTISWSSITWRR